MYVTNVLKDVDENSDGILQQHTDARGMITDLFYQGQIDHVAHVSSTSGARRGDHFHKETTQHILLLNGEMEYWYRDSQDVLDSEMVVLNAFDMVTTPPYEIHALRFRKDTDFIVFSEGKRGGRDYESDTFRVTPSIIKSDITKLHLGCGEKYLAGYTHIDITPHPHIDFVHPIDKLPMIDDNSIETIYCSNAFEYFDRPEAKDVLKEWMRVLKPGGFLRISVPDFAAICKVYSQHRNVNGRGILGPLYGKWNATEDSTIYHKTVYDHDSLTSMLEEAGFKDIKKWNPWWSLPKDYDDYSKATMPHMDKMGIHMAVNLEATKSCEE